MAKPEIKQMPFKIYGYLLLKAKENKINLKKLKNPKMEEAYKLQGIFGVENPINSILRG